MSTNIYKGVCPKCQNLFTKEIKWGHIPKFCSRSCANSRNHSIKTKEKISISLHRLDTWPHSTVHYVNCHKCDILFTSKRPAKYCINCRNKITIYRDKAKFTFTSKEYPHLFNDNRIQEYGWYRRAWPYPNAMVFDHLYRVSDGYKNNIPPNVLSHPANAELVTMAENRKRQAKSTITIKELY